ncbi:type VI secretion system-associated FHA domain protein TagH [Candidatus Thiosymbion oneisti]|uniref:type VI secretion system-associated FHA domain protein TagH n=1 Tax=Candidatus Thiosymbion oneisti TaxID=589554 RepID=UPI0010609262|nr:type VI secretion system-associated FHA domain protein TagH [Candidatus Thiosymbion oneisti]
MELILTVVRYQDRPAQSTPTARIGITGGTIGRNPDNELALADPERWVGRQHARISFREGAFFLTDTSKNGTFVNNAAEPFREGQEVELHDGDVLSIGAYEIRVSQEVSQPQPVASIDPLAGGRPEFESYAQTPSGGAVPDIMDLVGETSAASDPFSPPAASQEASAGPDDWLMSAPSEEGHRTLRPERESSRAPAAATEPDHTPDWNASYSPPEAVPEDYDIWADASRPQPGEQDLPTGGPESPSVPAVSDPVLPVGGPESSSAPTAPEPVLHVGDPESPSTPATPDPLPFEEQKEWNLPTGGPEPPIASAVSDPASRLGGPESSPAPTAPKPALHTGSPEFPTASIAPNPAPREGQPVPTPPSGERTQETRSAPTIAGETDALQAFLTGLDTGELPADRQAQAELMRTTGLLLRAMTEGLMRVLMGRASFKNELRLEMTRIQATENNPFKFSVDPRDALAHLLFRPSRGFLPPLEATREAFDDIQCHEMALVAGLRAALHALLKRLDPTELEKRFRDPSFIDNLMPMARKAKYWDLFTETYQAIAADAADDFMNLFRDAFTRAYEDQAARLRQARPHDKTSP